MGRRAAPDSTENRNKYVSATGNRNTFPPSSNPQPSHYTERAVAVPTNPPMKSPTQFVVQVVRIFVGFTHTHTHTRTHTHTHTHAHTHTRTRAHTHTHTTDTHTPHTHHRHTHTPHTHTKHTHKHTHTHTQTHKHTYTRAQRAVSAVCTVECEQGVRIVGRRSLFCNYVEGKKRIQ